MKYPCSQCKSAMTLLEIIFVIVILGIVSSIGAEIIANVYQGYIVQRAQYRANLKTELVLNAIGNRLHSAIKSTIVYREHNISDTPIPITSNVVPENVRVLQWVGADRDSFEAINSDTNLTPGWSGFCDLNASTKTTIVTPGSSLTLARDIISNLGGDINKSAIFFADANDYNISDITDENITLETNASEITERYKLAWTSYAIEIDKNNNMILHYHFTPWTGTDITNDKKSILIRNVSNFRINAKEESIRIKLCIEERLSADINDTVHSCKEKVIF